MGRLKNTISKAFAFALILTFAISSASPLAAQAKTDETRYYKIASEMYDTYISGEKKLVVPEVEKHDPQRLVDYMSLLIPFQMSIAIATHGDTKTEYEYSNLLEIDKRIAEGMAVAKSVVRNHIKSDMTDREKIKAIHDWVVNKNDYPETLRPDGVYSAVQLFLYGNSVCSGYARAVKILCDLVDIPCTTIVGSADGEPHLWNLVFIDGKWMHLDATYDDPIGTNKLLYDYFLKTTAEISKDHSFDSNMSFDNQVGLANYYYFKHKPLEEVPADVTPLAAAKAPMSGPAVKATPTSSKVYIDIELISFDAYNINGSNYFKLRDIAYVLSGTLKQFDVTWNEANNSISLSRGRKYTVMGGELSTRTSTSSPKPVLTTSNILLDGKEITLTAYNIGGSNYFKLSDIGKAFDFNVSWDGANNTIMVNTSRGYSND